MGDLFARYKPVNALRQPRIQYRTDNPDMAVLEELRQYGGFRRMNSLYLQALKLGAEIILKRAAAKGEWVRTDLRGGELSPVKVLPERKGPEIPDRPALPLSTADGDIELSPVKVSLPVASAVPANGRSWDGGSPAQAASAPQELTQKSPPLEEVGVAPLPDAPLPPVRRAIVSSAAAAQFAQFGD